ncbi:MAG: ABC transporter permease [Spirochaetaceae bacterium]
MKLSRIALRNVFRNGRRSLLSVTAVAVAALAITLMFAVFEGIKVDIRENSWNYEAGQVRIRNADFDRYEYLNPVQYVVPEAGALVSELRELPNVRAVSPRINVQGVSFRDDRSIAARGIGVDLERESEYQDLASVVARGRLPEPGSSEAILGAGLARELGVEIGDMATFLTETRTRASNAFTVDVVGIAAFSVAAMNNNAYIMSLEAAARYIRAGDGVSEILIKGDDVEAGALARTVRSALDRHGPEGMNVTPWTEVSGGYAYLQAADVIYAIIALVFFILASTVVINTTMMTIHERTHEIGTLSAMGMHGRELVRLFFTEASYLGLAGSAAGVILGVLVALPLQHVGIDLGPSMEMADMDMSNVLYPVLNVRSTLFVFVYSSAVAMAASFLPARRAARLKPVEALRQ